MGGRREGRGGGKKGGIFEESGINCKAWLGYCFKLFTADKGEMEERGEREEREDREREEE